MKSALSFLVSLFFLPSVVVQAQTCQVAMGVASANEGCHEDIVSEIMVYSQIVHREECGLPSGRRNLLEEEEEDGAPNKKKQLRGLQTQQQCDTWQIYCTLGINPNYYCQAYYSCLRRDLHEEEGQQDQEADGLAARGRRRELSGEPTENPLTEPGWMECTLDFSAFLEQVDTSFLAMYATDDIRTCWSYMWCRTKSE